MTICHHYHEVDITLAPKPWQWSTQNNTETARPMLTEVVLLTLLSRRNRAQDLPLESLEALEQTKKRMTEGRAA